MFCFNRFKGFVKICIFAVASCNGKHSCYTSFFSGFVCLVGTYVIARACRRNYKYALGGANTFAHTARKIKKTGSIYYIYLAILPLNRCYCSRNRSFASLFFRIKVENRIAVCNPAHSVYKSCPIKHCFCKCCFSPRAVTGNRNIANILCFV